MIQENEMSYPTIGQGWGIVGLGILSMILFSPVLILLDDFTGKEIAFFVYYVLSMGAVFWIAHLKRKKWTGAREYDFGFSSARIMILVSVMMVALQAGLVVPLVSLVPVPEFMKKVLLEMAPSNGVFSFITIVIAAPILEELIFRGIILDGLLKKYSPERSIIVSSILFGVVHLNPWQFIAAFIIGVFSGWVYYKTRKLTLSILIHCVNNLLPFVSMYFSSPETVLDESLIGTYGGWFNLIAITFGAITMALICLYFLRREIQPMKLAVAPRESSDPN